MTTNNSNADSIEAEFRAERDPTNPAFLEAVIRDVAERPGYYTARPRPFLPKTDKRRLASEVVRRAVKDGKLRRGFNGKLFPTNVKPFTIFQLAGMIAYSYFPLARLLALLAGYGVAFVLIVDAINRTTGNARLFVEVGGIIVTLGFAGFIFKVADSAQVR